MNRIRYPYVPPKGGSETLFRCLTNKPDILVINLCYSFFALKVSNKALAPDAPDHKMQLEERCNCIASSAIAIRCHSLSVVCYLSVPDASVL